MWPPSRRLRQPGDGTQVTAAPIESTLATGVPVEALEASRPRYVVLGLGNRLQGDEALGGLVIEQLRADPARLGPLADPAAVECLDGGTVGLGLLPHLCELDGLVVVDIIDAEVRPGTLLDLDGVEVLRHDTVMGVHELGAEELLGALLFMDALPRRVRVIGFQPEAISLGLDLSPSLAAGLPALIDAIGAHLRAWQEADGSTG
jgi:hydrogenase maturation protease